MSDTGTITEIEPEDGLGWIELESGDRVRFGGTACKGFVPAVGMTVEVLGTRPGYGGTLKATELARVADAPKAPMAKGSVAAPEPRTGLHTLTSSGIRAEELLLTVLGRADVDDALHADLAAAGLTLAVGPGLAHGVPNPWFYRIATGPAGDAYGLYAHPMFAAEPAAPWLRWASGALLYLAGDTAGFLHAQLATAAATADASTLSRLRGTLAKLGLPDGEGAPHGGGQRVAWLPPSAAELRPLDDYLAETDGGEMERGLLAHAYRDGAEARAGEALRSIYQQWGWQLPGWAG